MRSVRKPHNNTAGYVCERKSYHPRLPGHFVVIDHEKGGDWLDSGGLRWSVVHFVGDRGGCFVSSETKAGAIATMKEVAAGSDSVDFGQHEENPWWEEAQS